MEQIPNTSTSEITFTDKRAFNREELGIDLSIAAQHGNPHNSDPVTPLTPEPLQALSNETFVDMTQGGINPSPEAGNELSLPTEPEASEPSAEKVKKPHWLNRATRAAILNFRIARQVGFKNYAGEKLNAQKDKTVFSLNNLKTAFGDELVSLQRTVNEELGGQTVIEKVESTIENRYREFINRKGDKMLKSRIVARYNRALDRKLERKRIVTAKVDEMRRDIAARKQNGIREAVRRQAINNKASL